jgi:hypothetical protein
MTRLPETLLDTGRQLDLLQRRLRFLITASAANPWRMPVLNRNLFRGKRVVVLGPAQTVFDDLQGLDVESFDFIVRLNNGIALALEHPEKLGSRTDILFHNLNEDGARNAGAIPPSLLLQQKVRFCVFPHWGFKGSKTRKTRLYGKRKELSAYPEISLVVPPAKFCDEVRRDLGGYQPTTGTSAILFFLQCDLKELQLHGFSFFETRYVTGYNHAVTTDEEAQNWAAASSVHDPAREKAPIRNSIAQARKAGVTVILGNNVARFLASGGAPDEVPLR